MFTSIIRSKINTLFIISSILYLTGCGGGEQSQGQFDRRRGSFAGSQTGSLPVIVDTVKSETISTFILTNTTLEAQRTVNVIARVSGIVRDYYFEEGAVVKKGDLLVKLDDRELKLNMELAKSRAENTLRLFNRSKEMFEKSLVSKETYDDAKFQYETLESQFQSAKLQWEYTSIVAPINGVITTRSLELGDYITTNRIVCSIADYDLLLARIFIPEREISNIRLNQFAKITVEALTDQEFSGEVQMINPVVDPNSGTVKVTVKIARKSSGLLPGMFASVYLLTDTHNNAITIPKKSLVLESETDRVFVFENGSAVMRDVKTGFTEGERIEIIEGVQPGEWVISVGHEGLRDGSSVRLVGTPTSTQVAMSDNGTDTGRTNPDGNSDRTRHRGGEENGQREGGQRQQQGMREGGRRGNRGGSQLTPEMLERFKERLLANSKIKEEYDKKIKDDPDFVNDTEKQIEFFREMAQKYSQRRRQ